MLVGGYKVIGDPHEFLIGKQEEDNSIDLCDGWDSGLILALGFSDIIILIKGFFEETLPKLQSKFCFALIDCDLEKSVIFAAEHVWKNLSKNGIIVFDDYTAGNFQGAKKGIDFFVNKHKNEIIKHGLKKGLYFVKKI